MKKFSPLHDMRPGHYHNVKKLENINEIEQVIEFVYLVRCNLFHGAKSPGNRDDVELVELSAQVLMPWLKVAYENEKKF